MEASGGGTSPAPAEAEAWCTLVVDAHLSLCVACSLNKLRSRPRFLLLAAFVSTSLPGAKTDIPGAWDDRVCLVIKKRGAIGLGVMIGDHNAPREVVFDAKNPCPKTRQYTSKVTIIIYIFKIRKQRDILKQNH